MFGKNEVKKLAYEFAKKINVEIPTSWEEHWAAGRRWFDSFLQRHPVLSVRKPEATSMARARAFNRENVNMFFNNYNSVLDGYPYQPASIWNMDETGFTTVPKADRVVSRKGFKCANMTNSFYICKHCDSDGE